MLTKGIKSGIIVLHGNHKCGRKAESEVNKMFISKKRYHEIKERISSLETHVRILQSQSQAMTFYYGKVDFPKFAELIEHDISDLKVRK